MQPDILGDLHCVLDDERAALLDARYSVLAPLEAAKIALLAELEQQPAPRKALAGIKVKLDQNQALLAAAIAGVQTACTRVAALQDVRDGLSIYDEKGMLARVRATQTAVERKA